MSFFAPFLLGGLALIGLPILIHRIRRPERDTVRFSSLMFVPDVPKQVIERRKIQHLLLLILRILLLALLAFAFSRPFFTQREQTVFANNAASYHLILIDTSLSMSMGNRLDEAKALARDLMSKIGGDDRVGLAQFDRQGRLLVDFTTGGDSSLRNALQSLEVRPIQGDYLAGLRFAEGALLKTQGQDEAQQAVLHLISDFQIVPHEAVDWRLSGRIEFQGHRVGSQALRNLAVTEADVRLLGEDRLQIAAKIRYWQGEKPTQVEVSLKWRDGNGPTVEPQTLVLEPGSASLAVFDVPRDQIESVTGFVEIEADDLNIDNRFHLHWEPDPKRPLILVTQEQTPAPRSAAWFVENAIQAGQGTGWNLERMTPATWIAQERAAALGKAALFVGAGPQSTALERAITDHLDQGGKALIILGESEGQRPLADSFLRENGVAATWESDAVESAFEPWQWVAFDHPIFSPFGAARFNDFSQIHIYQRWNLAITSESVRVLAKTEQAPLMAEVTHGTGKALVWAFSPELTHTNLPKHIKFVPILEETLRYLSQGPAQTPRFDTGTALSRVTNDLPAGAIDLKLPDGSVAVPQEAAQTLLLETGWLQRQADTKGEWQTWAAVNVPSSEGNTVQGTVSEFALRLTATRQNTIAGDDTTTTLANIGIRKEFGFSLLMLIGLFLALETWLAFRLSRAAQPAPLPKEGS